MDLKTTTGYTKDSIKHDGEFIFKSIQNEADTHGMDKKLYLSLLRTFVSSYMDFLPTIINISDQEYITELIHGRDLSGYSFINDTKYDRLEITDNIGRQIRTIIASLLNFKTHTGYFFRDIGWRNFVVEDHSEKVYLVDYNWFIQDADLEFAQALIDALNLWKK